MVTGWEETCLRAWSRDSGDLRSRVRADATARRMFTPPMRGRHVSRLVSRRHQDRVRASGQKWTLQRVHVEVIDRTPNATHAQRRGGIGSDLETVDGCGPSGDDASSHCAEMAMRILPMLPVFPVWV